MRMLPLSTLKGQIPAPAAAPTSTRRPNGAALDKVSGKVRSGERLTHEDGLDLIACNDLAFLSELATLVRFRQNPRRRVTYIVDRNINPTNICVARCRFCAFDRLPGDPEGYVLTPEEVFRKVDELMAVGGVQVLVQGGHHPQLGVDHYADLFRALRKRYPSLHIHGLSPSEIVHVGRVSRLTVGEVIDRLREAGLDSIPGGGGEILVDSVRRRIAPHKAMTEEWLGVMREAHRRGMRSTATMMYGHVETPGQRIEHLLRLRELQDETGGFTAFIAWPFQPGGSELDLPRSGAHEFLRTNAVARLMLDNVPHQQTSFITQGEKVAQLALFFGCDDFGGTMLEENVVSAAGTRNLLTIERMEWCIRQAGFEPARRNMYYQVETSAAERARGLPWTWLGKEPRAREIERKVESGERLSVEEGLFLHRTPDLAWVGRLANAVRERLHGNRAFFVVNRHLNPSNYCVYSCSFCAFARKPGEEGAYRLSLDRVRRMLREEFEPELTEVHIVGGLDPKLPYSYYLDLLRLVREERPALHIKAFTMIEIDWLSRIGRKPVGEVLDDLLAAGLGSCPGGGVEVLSDRVHREIFHEKLSPDQWLETARLVQERGIRMNATILYGHLETDEERVVHLARIRELQDRTAGFLTFIPLAFHPANTALSHLPGPSGASDLRMIALSRLMLDNIEHVKTYWIMQGLGVAQSALSFGADDVDGTVVEERITHDAGASTPLGVTRDELVRLIREAGRDPVERDSLYRRLRPVEG